MMKSGLSRDSHTGTLNQIEEINRQIHEIAKVIADIDRKTKTINNIVLHAKILSFASSAEPTPFGQYKDFENSIREIHQRIDRLIQDIRTKAQAGTLVADDCSEALGEIVNRVDEISRILTKNEDRNEVKQEDSGSKGTE